MSRPAASLAAASPAAVAPMGAADWGLLGVLSVLWGGSFLFMRVLAFELPPFTVVFGRVAIAAAALGLALVAGGGRAPRGWRAWAACAGMGVLNNLVPFSLLVWGETRIPGGLAAIVNATTPLFSILVAHAFTADERLTPRRVAGVALGLGGVVVLMGPDALAGSGQTPAILACVAAALSYGCANTYGRRFRRLGLPPGTVAFGQVASTAAMSLPLMLLADRPWTLPMPSPAAWAALGALGLVSTGLAYLIFFRLLAGAGAVNVSMVTLLVPVSAVLLGWAALGERPGAAALAGMALIALGLLAIDGRVFGPGRTRPKSY